MTEFLADQLVVDLGGQGAFLERIIEPAPEPKPVLFSYEEKAVRDAVEGLLAVDYEKVSPVLQKLADRLSHGEGRQLANTLFDVLERHRRAREENKKTYPPDMLSSKWSPSKTLIVLKKSTSSTGLEY